MRFLRRGLLLGLVLTLFAMQLSISTLAQQSGTPAAGIPAASEEPLGGRLGGSLASFEALYGPPDFTGDGLIRYDAVTLNGNPTILVVYFDASEVVTRLALVYAARPTNMPDTAGIQAASATVAPTDGACEATAVSTGFGNEVYPCHSAALESVFTADRLITLGVTQGDPGDYSVAVDPLPDAYFELIVQPGTDGASLAPAPVPGAPTAAATPTLAEQYPPLTDPAALMDGDIPLQEGLSFTGDILTLQVAEFGMQYHLGADESLGASSLFQVEVPAQGSADAAVLFVGYNGDASILAIGDTVTVYGVNAGTQCFDNARGDEICQPLIAADMVEQQAS
ncbi:MAG TPA: hypothetical protein VFP05_08130 [Thermomicrobiales bacterium]|nr:hypothetical protein [Thermomicrobiales bacterium]